jgi:hypothetical protein
MFYVASGTIAAEHPELAEAIAALDEHLFRQRGHALRLDFTADILGIDRSRLTRLMGLFADKQVVEKAVGYVCPTCDGLMEHVPNEGDLWCDECEQSVSFRGKGDLGVAMWRALPSAETTGRPLVEPAVDLPGGCPRQAVRIQFIGGDRGGATRPQLMLPREWKAIRDAISQGKYRDGFAFADAVHAASIDDLIACHRFHPGIVHFAGHGDARSLILVEDRDLIAEQRTLDSGQLVTLFRNYPTRVKLVFFNVCHSSGLARGLAESGVVDLAIGLPGQLADDPAIAFATTFYRQISEGLTVRQAFEMAGLHSKPAPGGVRHEIYSANGVDPSAIGFGW